jgi:hypothetical protein
MEAIGTNISRTLDKEIEAILAIQKYEPLRFGKTFGSKI